MIDAYEIGIQLVLQEDVSAGLEVINRGLAEVDQAIAATSANLAGLLQKAETGTKAVAVGMSAPTSPAPAIDHSAERTAEQVVQDLPPKSAVPVSVTRSAEKANVPDAMAVAPSIPAAPPPTHAPSNDKPASLPSVIREETVASVAPISDSPAETIVSEEPAGKTNTESRPSESVALAPIVPAAPRQNEPVHPPAVEVATAAHESPRSVRPPPSARPALTAFVNQARRPDTSATQPEQARYQPTAVLPSRRERAAAPWSGRDTSRVRTETNVSQDRTVSQQTASQEPKQSADGTVMLDGRLVGQWLADHMAREASRPPAGTSFFDPRQTPAWNVSGSAQ